MIVSTAVAAVLLAVVVLTHSIAVGALATLLLIAAYAYSPNGYEISGRSIVVKRLIGDVQIPLDDVREVRAATPEDFRGCLRLWGNGGLFGYYGLFRTSKLGKCTWYVTNRRNAAVVITGAKTVVFSPDDRDGFVAAIQPWLVPGPAPSSPLLALRASGLGRLIPMIIGGAVGVVGIAFGLFCVFYSPGPPSYRLTPQSLTIDDRFYPVTLNATNIDVDGIRIVDFRVDTDWSPTERTNGFANAHYRSGWFRVASGKTIRMYRAESKRLVLLPPKGDGTAVLLEAKEPEAFIDEVRRKWSTRS
jgi:hypothetical protein